MWSNVVQLRPLSIYNIIQSMETEVLKYMPSLNHQPVEIKEDNEETVFQSASKDAKMLNGV